MWDLALYGSCLELGLLVETLAKSDPNLEHIRKM